MATSICGAQTFRGATTSAPLPLIEAAAAGSVVTTTTTASAGLIVIGGKLNATNFDAY